MFDVSVTLDGFWDGKYKATDLILWMTRNVYQIQDLGPWKSFCLSEVCAVPSAFSLSMLMTERGWVEYQVNRYRTQIIMLNYPCFQPCLSYRTQPCLFANHITAPYINCGNRKGFVLGPLEFIWHSKISSVFDRHEVRFHLFADKQPYSSVVLCQWGHCHTAKTLGILSDQFATGMCRRHLHIRKAELISFESCVNLWLGSDVITAVWLADSFVVGGLQISEPMYVKNCACIVLKLPQDYLLHQGIAIFHRRLLVSRKDKI